MNRRRRWRGRAFADGPRLTRATERNVASGSVFSTVLLSSAVARFASGPTERVLDIGSGQSPYRELLDPSLYVGIDREPCPENPELLVIGDATGLPIADGTFTGLICTEVIEHVPDERQLVSELARVARPGAVLVLSSPFVHGLHELPHDYRRLTSIGLRTVLTEGGWAVERMVSVGGPVVVALDSLARWTDSQVGRLARRFSAFSRIRVDHLKAPSRLAQRALAAAVLHAPGYRSGAIDPDLPLPRLTLGYVVLARRTGS